MLPHIRTERHAILRIFATQLTSGFLHVVRENPDGSKTVLSHRDLTDEQARKLARQCERPALP